MLGVLVSLTLIHTHTHTHTRTHTLSLLVAQTFRHDVRVLHPPVPRLPLDQLPVQNKVRVGVSGCMLLIACMGTTPQLCSLLLFIVHQT